MTNCNNTTSVADLPTCDSVDGDSYIIVQNANGACKVKISDIVLGPDNSSFWPQIQQLIEKVNDLASVVQTNSASWNDTSNTVTTNKPTWDTIGDYNITNINERLTQGEGKWDAVTSTVNINSANWEATYQTVNRDKSKWTYAHDVIIATQDSWNKAYTVAVEGTIGAIHEAFETISTSPWWLSHSSWGGGTEETGPTKAQMYETWYHHQVSHDLWNSVYNTVKANSASW